MQVINAVAAEARICPQCGPHLTTVGHFKCEKLDVIPAPIIVIERLDERVACPKDDTIVGAPVPLAIVDGGKLGDALIVRSVPHPVPCQSRQPSPFCRGRAVRIFPPPSTIVLPRSSAIDVELR